MNEQKLSDRRKLHQRTTVVKAFTYIRCGKRVRVEGFIRVVTNKYARMIEKRDAKPNVRLYFSRKLREDLFVIPVEEEEL